jgi:hypothetical protein
MKDLFFRVCIGCFCILTVDYLYGFYCGLFDKVQDPYLAGFWGCLFWWIVYDAVKEMGWLK